MKSVPKRFSSRIIFYIVTEISTQNLHDAMRNDDSEFELIEMIKPKLSFYQYDILNA